jgi:hypothetical protein
LDPQIRFKKEYIKLAGIWFGSSKPDMSTFFTPLVQMLNDAWYKGRSSIVLCNKFIDIAIGIDVVTADNTSMKTTALLLPGLLDSSYLNPKM